MNIPDEVRTAILNCTKLVRNRGFPGDLVDVIMLLDWLQSQPTAPEPDWLLHDDWFDCFVMAPYGNTAHYFHGEDVNWYGDSPDIDDVFSYGDAHDLGDMNTYGIDWRTTLRRRPEATA